MCVDQPIKFDTGVRKYLLPLTRRIAETLTIRVNLIQNANKVIAKLGVIISGGHAHLVGVFQEMIPQRHEPMAVNDWPDVGIS